MPEDRALELERVGPVIRARLAGRHLSDEDEVLSVGRQLSEVLERGDCRELEVSLDGAEGVGSPLVGKLVALHKQAEATGSCLVLSGIEPHLHAALKEAGLTELFHIRD
jgi:anti-anti-sigma regulatory factor